jgi:hypothetical protein
MVRESHDALVAWGKRVLAAGAEGAPARRSISTGAGRVVAGSPVAANGRGRRTGWDELAMRVGVSVGRLKELARRPRERQPEPAPA